MTQTQTTKSSTKNNSSKTKKAASSSSSPSPALPVGRFCWLALRTPDVKKSQAFYGDVVGWTLSVKDLGGASFETFAGSEAPVCHVEVHKGPAAFLSYVVVDDVDAAARRVTAAGGRVLGSVQRLPGVGAMLEVQDGDGAVCSLFQPASVEAAQVSKAPGGLLWSELWAKDERAAVAFLTAVCGYVVDVSAMPDGPYHVLRHGEEMQAGVMKSPDPSSSSAWVPYLHVVDVDAARRRALAAGATALGDLQEVPGIGRTAALLDPQGARFALLQPAA